MAGTEIRIDTDRVREVLRAMSIVYRELLMAQVRPPDMSERITGHRGASAAAEAFTAQWSEGHQRILDNLQRVHQAGNAAVSAYEAADRSVDAAARGHGAAAT